MAGYCSNCGKFGLLIGSRIGGRFGEKEYLCRVCYGGNAYNPARCPEYQKAEAMGLQPEKAYGYYCEGGSALGHLQGQTQFQGGQFPGQSQVPSQSQFPSQSQVPGQSQFANRMHNQPPQWEYGRHWERGVQEQHKPAYGQGPDQRQRSVMGQFLGGLFHR